MFTDFSERHHGEPPYRMYDVIHTSSARVKKWFGFVFTPHNEREIVYSTIMYCCNGHILYISFGASNASPIGIKHR